MAPPYRDDERALRLRLAALDEQLREARELRERRRALDEASARLEAERAEVAERLASLEGGVSLEGLRVASPCKADWNAMAGDERVRFCGQCQKNVYNLSGMARAEAEALVHGAEGKLCIRMFRRADGTVLTGDCPDGVSRKRRRRLAIVAGSGALATASAFGLAASTVTMGARAPREMTMGEMQVALPDVTAPLEVPTQIDGAPVDPDGQARPAAPVEVVGEWSDDPAPRPASGHAGKAAPPTHLAPALMGKAVLPKGKQR